MGEFELIRQVFMPVARATASPDIVVGPGDDCAVQAIPPGSELVFSIDTLVEGVHFPPDYPPEFLAWRSLAAAASDLAAMGADPVCFTLAMTLPESDEAWLTAFGRGLGSAAANFQLALAGGDVTCGPLTITIQVHGTLPAGTALLRSGARPGDLVCVSGCLGDGAAALHWLKVPDPGEQARKLLEKYHHPVPRLALGVSLRGRASAAIDISDGLLADLSHILEASNVGAQVDADKLPLSASLLELHPDEARTLALEGGDDYELCFTLPQAQWQSVSQQGLGLTVIGRITDRRGLWLSSQDGERKMDPVGYDHFRGYRP